MNKNLLGMIMSGMLMASMVGCTNSDEYYTENGNVYKKEDSVAEDTESVVQQPSEEKEQVPTDKKLVQGDEFSIKITSVQKSGNDMVINYDYNNESSEEQTPIFTVAFQCYQNGVELEHDSFGMSNHKNQDGILGGYSNQGLEDRETLNDQSKVLIRVTPWVDFSDTLYAEFEFDPTTNELIRSR